MMISFDVSSLFTKVPVDEILEIVEQRLLLDHTPEDQTTPSLMDLLRICMKTTYFL